MKKAQDWHLKMYQLIRDRLTEDSAIVSPLPGFGALFTSLQNGIDNIYHLSAIQGLKTTGIATNKKNLRDNLIAKAFDVACKTTSYAAIAGDYILKKEVKCSESVLKKSDNANLVNRCQLIHDRANDNIASLGAYGVDAAALTALQSAIDAFFASIPEPGIAIEEKKHATQQLAKLFAETDDTLEKIDALMEIVRLSEKSFYRQYKSSRRITKTGVRYIALRAKAVDKSTGEAVKDAIFKFTPEDEAIREKIARGKGFFIRKTTAKGGFFVKHAPDGMYTVEVTKEDYKPFHTKTPIVGGELTRLNVELERE